MANKRRRAYTIPGWLVGGKSAKLTEAELAALRERLSAMPLYELETFYKAVHNACRYTEVRAPAPAVVQEFVQAWKALRRVKRKV